MELEWLAAQSDESGTYEFELIEPHIRQKKADMGHPCELSSANDAAPAELDWAPMVRGILADLSRQTKQEAMARKFHNTLAEMIALIAGKHAGLPLALSGGCFQNRLLTELTVARLEADGVKVYWHQRVPPNDGGIALGQVVAAARQLRFEKNARVPKCV